MSLFIGLVLLTWTVVWLLTSLVEWLKQILPSIRQKLFSVKSRELFGDQYINAKNFYRDRFRRVPCISFIGSLDAAKAFDYIKAGLAGKVVAVYQRSWYNWQTKRQEFTMTVFQLECRLLIELGDGYAEILFDRRNYAIANNLVEQFAKFREPEKEEEYEINIITFSSGRLRLKDLGIKPAPLDIGLYYNDDFKEVDELIKSRLSKENDKGIVLLHGLPGTGKTTYLRHLVGSLKKRVLFISPGVAGNLMNPEFIDLLIDNPNSILVIEDAENIIMDRRYSSDSSVSNLLNISDGLMSDCLNVQIICTFNSAVSLVDSALLRKGRLIAKYEFGKLEVSKARKLSEHLGLNQIIDQPMILAEITNPGQTYYEAPKAQVVGFRRELLEN